MEKSKIIDLLDTEKVKYKVIKHEEVFTAQEMAAAAHIPGKQLAKTVMVKVDNDFAMVVLPAPLKVDLEALKAGVGAKKVKLASEKEFQDLFPDCEIGAMPPFGNLYGIDVFVAEDLSEELTIAFCGGSHTELIQLSFKDFERLAEPKILNFAISG